MNVKAEPGLSETMPPPASLAMLGSTLQKPPPLSDSRGMQFCNWRRQAVAGASVHKGADAQWCQQAFPTLTPRHALPLTYTVNDN